MRKIANSDALAHACVDRLRPLVILAKSWAKARGISNAPCGFLNSFGYSMLVIYYLQR
jgi:DNA polymerase sigma